MLRKHREINFERLTKIDSIKLNSISLSNIGVEGSLSVSKHLLNQDKKVLEIASPIPFMLFNYELW